MLNKLKEINSCEVCGKNELFEVLDLGLHPMCDDLVKIGENRICKEYPIQILFCQNCKTAHQRFQVPKEELFPKSYHYRSRFTADVLSGMENLVNSCEELLGSLRNKSVLDIGCNDGSLLDFFSRHKAKTIGVEPTDACLDAEKKGHISFKDYLSEKLATKIVAKHGKPDIITFTNVFAHIDDLPEVLRSLKILMKSETILVIENHYLGSVLNSNQFDTFYHEHPRTYSYTSFVHMAKSLEVSIFDAQFPARYGGNIRVFLAKEAISKRLNSQRVSELEMIEESFSIKFEILGKNINNWVTTKKMFIQEQFNLFGKLSAKAFPGRAAILVKLLNLDENIISAVYEKPGSMKIGSYLPGTRIPIRSDRELFQNMGHKQPILNLAWHIPNEIKSYLRDHGFNGQIIDVVNEGDFL